MTDRDKVIKGLEWHIRTTKARECKYALVDCPYVEECKTSGSEKLLEDTLAMLKEQEPVKPRSVTRHGSNSQIQHFCGKCNAILFHKKQKYCIDCGTPAKWE